MLSDLVRAKLAALDTEVGRVPAAGAFPATASTLTTDADADASSSGMQLEVEILEPELVGGGSQRECCRAASVVDQAVEPAEAFGDLLGKRLDLIRLRDVAAQSGELTGSMVELARGSRQPFLAAPTDHRRRTLINEGLGERQAQAIAPAGDEHHLVLELEVHDWSFPSASVRRSEKTRIVRSVRCLYAR